MTVRRNSGFGRPGRDHRLRRRQRGVTLLEMLVVLVIIALLAGLVGVRLLSQVDRSKAIAAKAQIETLVSAVESLRADIGRLPEPEEGLNLLTAAPQEMVNWFGPYLDEGLPADPWGRPYRFEVDASGREFYLYTLGADDQVGGQGAAQDIGRLPK
ncbi:MAG TPA: type II secretion system protein GspG [Parvularcula sp.]|nr:type II secretion system protein GspG [Parvularcula sp.]HBS33298.1 type II secretion system protein GspG [Parvularcula sp.]HBS35695.1 type II secretion system protein GspG [Parvularcula sp.]